jgi:hypothetical protein
MGGSSSGTAGSTSGTAGSASGSGGTSGAGGTSAGNAGSGGSSSCEGPTGSECATASTYCAGYPYETGDLVIAVCTVGTAGCISGRTMLFECQSGCDTHSPTTIVDNQYWRIEAQCP